MASRSFFLLGNEKELCRHGNCYGWNVCITPKFLCGSLNCQWDSIWKRGCGRELGLDKVMRVACPWPHKKRNRNTAPVSLPCEDTARAQPPASWEEGSQQNPDHAGELKPLVFRAVKNICCLSHPMKIFCYSSPGWLREQLKSFGKLFKEGS